MPWAGAVSVNITGIDGMDTKFSSGDQRTHMDTAGYGALAHTRPSKTNLHLKVTLRSNW